MEKKLKIEPDQELSKEIERDLNIAYDSYVAKLDQCTTSIAFAQGFYQESIPDTDEYNFADKLSNEFYQRIWNNMTPEEKQAHKKEKRARYLRSAIGLSIYFTIVLNFTTDWTSALVFIGFVSMLPLFLVYPNVVGKSYSLQEQVAYMEDFILDHFKIIQKAKIEEKYKYDETSKALQYLQIFDEVLQSFTPKKLN